MVREALGNARTKGVRGYLDNLLKRVQLLDDAMAEAKIRGKLKSEFPSRFRRSFNNISNEVDAAYLEISQGKKVKAPALREIERFEAAEEKGILDSTHDPDVGSRPERAYEGTAYHDRTQDAVVKALPEGTVFTENTIQKFFADRNIISKKIPKRSTGIDVYVIDYPRKRVVPVDITGVGGGEKHVKKLIENVEDMRKLFEKAGLHMTEPIELEYVGQTFAEASQNIVNELKPFAR